MHVGHLGRHLGAHLGEDFGQESEIAHATAGHLGRHCGRHFGAHLGRAGPAREHARTRTPSDLGAARSSRQPVAIQIAARVLTEIAISHRMLTRINIDAEVIQ